MTTYTDKCIYSGNMWCVSVILVYASKLWKEEYARKRTHNGCLVQIESPVTQDNCSASLGKSCDAEQLPS